MKYLPFGNTGLQVSQLALGTGNFGTGWGYGTEADDCKLILDSYMQAGGNFIDTADTYQFGESESILGKLLQGRRDQVLLASKFSKGSSPQSGPLATGNSRRAMITSLEASLKRLNTDRIDLYWAHAPDGVTPLEELVRGLEDLSKAGKILYAGLSNFPAWGIARAATLAKLRGAIPIAAAQFEYSLVQRKSEEEIIPACQALGIAMMAWSPLGGGMLTGKYRNGESGRAQGFGGKVFQAENSVQRSSTLDVVLTIAKEVNATPDQIAIHWAALNGIFPLVGPRSHEQLATNLGAMDISLSAEQIQRLDHVSKVIS
jgi:aryl-alcohol dehydrogenase-like predicted oxidoreductase